MSTADTTSGTTTSGTTTSTETTSTGATAVGAGTPRPDVTPPGPWSFPVPTRRTLPNGIEVVAYDIPGQYVVSVRTALPLPLSAEPREVEGVATVMARLLDEGTAEHTPEEFAELLERKGIALGASVNEAGVGVDLDVPKRRLEEALDLLRLALSEPVFPQSEVDRIRRTRLAEIEQERALAPQRAAREFVATFYEEQDRASRPSAGTATTIAALTRQDVVDFHARHVGPQGMTAVVAGDLSDLDVFAMVERTLGTWQVEVDRPVAVPSRRAADAARIVLVDRPGSVQTEVLVGCAGPDRRAEGGWAPYPVLGFMVGGSPNARVDAVLREEKGYTYGIRSVFRPRSSGGLFLTSGSVRADATVESVQLLVEILMSGRDGFGADEVRAGVDFVSKTAPGRYATADAVADEASTMALEGLTTEFTTRNLEQMRALEPQALQDAYRRWVLGEWTVVVVGDAGSYADAIRGLGLGEVSIVPN